MGHVWRRLRRERRGATAIEYGLLLACIAMVLATAFHALNAQTGNLFGRVTAALLPT
ncbi:MAG: Flp family type IVb pilin [Sphingomonas fennica]